MKHGFWMLGIVALLGMVAEAQAGTYYGKVCGPVSEIAPIAGPVYVHTGKAVHTAHLPRGERGPTNAAHPVAKALVKAAGSEYPSDGIVETMEKYGVVATAPFSEKKVETREPVTELCVALASGGLTYRLENLSGDEFEAELKQADAEARKH